MNKFLITVIYTDGRQINLTDVKQVNPQRDWITFTIHTDKDDIYTRTLNAVNVAEYSTRLQQPPQVQPQETGVTNV